MDVRRIGVVGTGTMGRGIATVAATAGYEVIVRGRQESSAGAVLAAITKQLDRQVDKGTLAPDERDATLDRVRCTADLADLADCDLVIESIVEDRAEKSALFAQLDKLCREDTILASNTSTFPITELAVATRRPGRVCGMHFFNPATVMPLVEVASTLVSDAETVTTATEVARRCGKQAIAVDDMAGFVVNQILFGYFASALRLVNSSATPIADIDAAMRGGCNFPMGPFELMDLIGIDVTMAVFDALYEEYREPQFVCPPQLRRMAAAGHLGRKSGRGFYDHR